MLKDLFGGPQVIAWRLRVDPQQAVMAKLPIHPAMEIRWVWGVDQGNAALAVQPRQGGLQEPYFPYARLAGHEFDKRAYGPALAGKLAVQQGKTRGKGG